MRNIFLIVIVLIVNLLKAQDGSIDINFNSNDIGFGNGDGANGSVYTIINLQDGKKIVAGNFTAYNGFYKPNVVRVNQDGSNDQSFNIGNGANNSIYSCAVQQNGKIILGGNFTLFNDTPVKGIVRLNSDGSIDNSFSPFIDQISSVTVKTIKLTEDEKIYIGGEFNIVDPSTANSLSAIVRLNNDGSIDESFYSSSLGFISNSIETIAIQTDGKIVIGGTFTLSNFDGTSVQYIARLNPNRSLDTTFITPTFSVSGSVNCSAIQSDGKILIGGSFGIFLNANTTNLIARLEPDGTPDITFQSINGFEILADSKVNSLQVQSDGKIILLGSFSSYNNSQVNNILRLNSNATLDTTFQINSFATNSIVTSQLTPDNKILIGCENTILVDNVYYKGIIQLNSNGSFDSAFNKQTGFNGKVNIVNTQLTNKILVGGEFNAFNGVSQRLVSKLNTDGSLDDSFSLNGVGPDSAINDIKVQPDNMILLAGSFNNFNGEIKRKIIRLNPNGLIDNTFAIGNGFDGVSVLNLAIQPDEKIIASGIFNSYNGYNSKNIVRINSDGTVDNTFSIGLGANNGIQKSILQSDNKIIVVGSFTAFNGLNYNRIIRLNNDGSIDTTFNIGTGANSTILDAEIQTDNKIVITGAFTSFNGNPVNRIARLNSDGTLDLTFNSGTGANQPIHTLELLSNDKILIGGTFNQYNGFLERGIARLNQNGTLDNSFQTGSGFNPSSNIPSLVSTISVDQNGGIIVGGGFKAYANQGRNRIVRINDSSTLFVVNNNINTENLFAFSNNEKITINSIDKVLREVSIFDLTGRQVFNKKNINQNIIEIDCIVESNQILIIHAKNQDNIIKTIKLIH